MSWHYSQEPEEGFSVDDYLAGLRSARSRLSSTHAMSCSPDRQTDAFQPSLFGTMSAPSTGDRGGASWTLSQEGSPAPTSAQRVAVKDLPESVRVYGSRCSALLKRCGLLLSSRKTVRSFVPVVSAPLSKDLPAWGMTFGGACWELGTRATHLHPIEETGCGYMLPTPTANEYGTNTAIGGKPRPSLNTMARRNMWPTPQASDCRDRGHMGTKVVQRRIANGRQVNLGMVVSATSGKLSADWVEWLMGMPYPGWTDLGRSAMPRFRQWLRSHGVSCTEPTDDK